TRGEAAGVGAERHRGKRFPCAWVNSAHGERPHLVAFNTSYARDIISCLAVEPGVVDVGAEYSSVVLELVYFGIEGTLHVGDGAVGANGEAEGVGGNNGQPVFLKFPTNDVPLAFSRRV